MSADVGVSLDVSFSDRAAAKRFVRHAMDAAASPDAGVDLGGVVLMNTCIMLSWNIVTLAGNAGSEPDTADVLCMARSIGEIAGDTPGSIDVEIYNADESRYGHMCVRSGAADSAFLPDAVTRRIEGENADDPDIMLARLRVAYSDFRRGLHGSGIQE